MRGRRADSEIALAAAGLALLAGLPLVVEANTVLNFLVVGLILALAAQGWNILGGFGGQFSFGHAAFFGTGAYATAILQVRYGANAWAAFAAAIAAGALAAWGVVLGPAVGAVLMSLSTVIVAVNAQLLRRVRL